MAETYTKVGNTLAIAVTTVTTTTAAYQDLLDQKKWFEDLIVKHQADLALLTKRITEANKLGITAAAKP
jgi:hypothetical protein